MSGNVDVLGKILHEAHRARLSGDRVLAVFDLDSTLFDLTRRIQRILEEFAADPVWAGRFPEACRIAAKARISPGDWGLQEALVRAGLRPVAHPEFMHELHEYWAFRFFSSGYLIEDQPLPGAVEFVQELEREDAHIMYLTGRDVERMRDGTIASLRQWSFPLDKEHTRLVLKPEAGMDDAGFKVDVLKAELPAYRKIWLFENEPVNLNLVQKECPEIGLIYIETTHSGRERVAAELDRIPHFETDLAAFRKFRAKG